MFASRDKLGRIFTPSPVNRAHPLNRGRVAWWLSIPGMIGGRQFFDLMGLNHGTLTNFTSTSGWQGTTQPGGYGGLLFDGTDDLVATNGSLDLTGVPFSIFATIRLTAYATGSSPSFESGIFHKESGVGTTGGYYFAVNSSGKLLARIRNAGNTASSLTGNATIALKTWYRVGMTYDLATLRLWINGGLDNSASTSLVVGAVPAQVACIGNASSALSSLAGNDNDVSLFTRSRGSAEVQQDYILSQQGYPDVLNRLSSRVYYFPKTFNAAWFRVPRQTMEAA